MIIKRFFVGYDARSVRNPVRNSRGIPELEEAVNQYAVDDYLWPSLWSTSLVEEPRPEYLGPVQNLWAELSQLRQYTQSAMGKQPREPWMFIAAEVFIPDDQPEKDVIEWAGRCDSVEIVSNAGWISLGYDVCDYYLGSWYVEDRHGTAKFARMFGGAKGVLRDGLFVDADRAQRFADELTRTHDRDWYVYQLWRVDELRQIP